jgi:membrane-bound lytic murein transglycosylase B
LDAVSHSFYDKGPTLRIRFCSAIFLGIFCGALSADSAEFERCMTQLQQQATAHGISRKTVDEVIPSLQYQARVIELDRSQPEFTQSFADYFASRVSQGRIDKGQALYALQLFALRQRRRR